MWLELTMKPILHSMGLFCEPIFHCRALNLKAAAELHPAADSSYQYHGHQKKATTEFVDQLMRGCCILTWGLEFESWIYGCSYVKYLEV